MKYFKFYVLAFAIIIIDQAVKLWVHTYMENGLMGEIPIFGDWFKLHYTTNPGMAFGLEFGSAYGKLGLTLFRLLAMTGIAYFLYKAAHKEGYAQGFLWCVALILGGAIGNVIDSTFYGFFLDNAPFTETPPPFYPWFHGQVIDMFYLDIWEGQLPESLPLIGGNYYSLWPIFNVADASIFVGVAVILIFQRRFFPVHHKEEPTNENPSVEVSDNTATN